MEIYKVLLISWRLSFLIFFARYMYFVHVEIFFQNPERISQNFPWDSRDQVQKILPKMVFSHSSYYDPSSILEHLTIPMRQSAPILFTGYFKMTTPRFIRIHSNDRVLTTQFKDKIIKNYRFFKLKYFASDEISFPMNNL